MPGERSRPRSSAPSADADVVLLVLSDDNAVLEVCERDGGVLASLGSSTVLANVSTVSPDTICHLAAIGPADRVLDDPLWEHRRTWPPVTCRFFVGGPLPTITSCDPLWTDLGAGYTHCGPVGTAAIMKLISNLLLITGVASLAEAIATARSHGIADELLQNVFGESPVISPPVRSGWGVSWIPATQAGSRPPWPARTFASPSAWLNRRVSPCASARPPTRS